MAYPLLNVSPSQLEFLFEAERELKSVLNLRNVNDGVRVAFKIKVVLPFIFTPAKILSGALSW